MVKQCFLDLSAHDRDPLHNNKEIPCIQLPSCQLLGTNGDSPKLAGVCDYVTAVYRQHKDDTLSIHDFCI